MREIVLDTETTGLNPDDGHRVVEIGCIELINHMPTRRVFHTYLNPECDMPEDAFRITGLSAEFLRDKPLFPQEARRFLEFIGEAPLVIHNAKFDIGFLNSELARAGFAPLPEERAICTATMARAKFPGAPASLDALCKRFGVDNTMREKHGALLDCELLAQVYLYLIGGRQPALALTGDTGLPGERRLHVSRKSPRPEPLPTRLTEAELAAHDAFVAKMAGDVVWAWEPQAHAAAE